MGKLIDLTGQTFGKLSVLEITNKRSHGVNGNVMWKVQCVGGCNSEPYLVPSSNLTNGHSTQCKECQKRAYIVDLTGKVFGKLRVLEITDKRSKNRDVMWRVQCTGGCNSAPYLIRSGHLISGHSTQCRRCSMRNLNSIGSISKTEKLLIDRVEKYVGTQVVRQFRIENRFYDAYIPKYNLLIESNGEYWHERNGTDDEKKALAKEYEFNLIGVTNNSQKDIPLCFNIIKHYINNL